MRCNIRRALSGMVNHNGSSTPRTVLLSISSMGVLPMVGKTWFSKLDSHEAWRWSFQPPFMAS